MNLTMNTSKCATAMLGSFQQLRASISGVGVKLEAMNVFKRYYSPEPAKRFYGEVTVKPTTTTSDSSYEIYLDKKKLKTPSGKAIFNVKNETLANVVATEWASQKRQILQSQMHLTALANTVQDNPLRRSKTDVITNILDNLPQDTIIFRCPDNEKLFELQEKEWNPIIAWLENKYDVVIPIVDSSILPVSFSESTLNQFRSSLDKLNFESLTGLHYGVGAVQSVILALAVVDQRLSVEEAVNMSRLELRFQIDHWGNVEWAHDLEKYDSMSRLSAAMIFVYTHSKSPFSSLSI